MVVVSSCRKVLDSPIAVSLTVNESIGRGFYTLVKNVSFYSPIAFVNR